MALFPGDSRYELILSTAVSGTTITAWSDVRKNSGGGFYTSDPQWWRIRISGADRDGSWTYDFTGGTPKTLRVGDYSRNVGYGSFLVETWVNMDSGFGQAYEARWVTITNPATPPGAPTGLAFRESARSATNLGVEYSRGPANGAAIDQDNAEWSRVADGVVVWNDYGSNTFTSPQGGAVPGAPALSPGTEYRVRVRSHNAAGWGPFSGYVTSRTLARARVPKGGAYVPAAQVTVPKAGALIAAAAVRVPKAGAYVDAV